MSSSLLADPSLDLLSLAHSFEQLSAGALRFRTLPNDGPQLIYPDGVMTSVVGVDRAAVPSFVRTVIGQKPDLSGVTPAPPASVTVDVLNGAEVYRLAARNAARLRALGFHTDLIDSTREPVSTTAVQYPPGQAAAGKALAAVVPGAELMRTAAVHRVTLVLGSDSRQVQGVAPVSGGAAAAAGSGSGSSTAAAGPPGGAAPAGRSGVAAAGPAEAGGAAAGPAGAPGCID